MESPLTGQQAIPSGLVPASHRKSSSVFCRALFLIAVLANFIAGIVVVKKGNGLAMLRDCAVDDHVHDDDNHHNANDDPFSGRNAWSLLNDHLAVFIGMCACVIAGTAVWLYVMRNCTAAVVWGMLITSLACSAAIAGLLFKEGMVRPALFQAALTVLGLLALFFLQRRINMTVKLLRVSMQAMAQYPSMLVASLGIVIVLSGLALLQGGFLVEASTLGTLIRHSNGTCDIEESSARKPAMAFFAVMLLWMAGTLVQLRVFVTAHAGAFWYFNAPGPEHPVWTGMKLGLWKQLGGVAISGAVLALITFLRAMVRKARRQHRRSIVAAIFACLAECILRVIETMNRFATIVMAVLGGSFMDACKQGKRILSGSFVGGVVADRVAARVLYLSSLLIGLACGLIIWLVLDKDLNTKTMHDVGYIILFIALVAVPVAGLLIGLLLAVFIQSGPIIVPLVAIITGASAMTLLRFVSHTVLGLVDTMFVCYAMDEQHATVATGQDDTHAVMKDYLHETKQARTDGGQAAVVSAPEVQHTYVQPAQGVPPPGYHAVGYNTAAVKGTGV